MRKFFLTLLIITATLTAVSCSVKKTSKTKNIKNSTKQAIETTTYSSWESSKLSIKTINRNLSFFSSFIDKGNRMLLDFNQSNIVPQNNIIFLTSNGWLKSIKQTPNTLNFTEEWKMKIFHLPNNQKYISPQIVNLKEIFITIIGTNQVIATNINSKKIIWQKNFLSIPVSINITGNQSNKDSTILQEKQHLIVLTNDNKTYYLDPNDGNTIWSHEAVANNVAIAGSTTPIAIAKINQNQEENFIATGYSNGEIYFLKQSNGEILFSKNLNKDNIYSSEYYLNDIDSNIITDNQNIYAVSNSGRMIAIRIADGNIVWKLNIATIIDFIILEKKILAIDNHNRLLSINISDGNIIKEMQLPKFLKKKNGRIIYKKIIPYHNNLLIFDNKGNIISIKSTLEKVSKYYTTGFKNIFSPTILKDNLYFHFNKNFSEGLAIIDLKQIK